MSDIIQSPSFLCHPHLIHTLKTTTYTQNGDPVPNVYKRSTQYDTRMSKKEIYCFDDSQSLGEFLTLDTNLWEQIDYTFDDQKRINIGRPQYLKCIRVYIQRGERGTSHEISNYILLDRKEWAELRRVRGKTKGLPLDINNNGTLWIGDRFGTCNFKIFVRKDVKT